MRKVFRDIRALDWKKEPVEEMQECFSKFGNIPFMVTDFHEGRLIHRARPINEDEIVNTVNGLSYRPQEKNEFYQRASIPQKTMLYGAVLPPVTDIDGINNSRITSAMETVPFLRNPKLDGEKRLLYGKWRVKSKVSLITILFTKFNNAKTEWLKGIIKDFYDNIKPYPYNDQRIFKQVNNFYAGEFAKFVGENEEYKYLVSALFSNMCTQNGHDGVIFPSVRTMGLGINVAIKPEAVDEKMELISVLDCKVYKKGKKVIVNNLGYCDVSPNNSTFELNEITDSRYRFSDEQIKVMLQ